MLASHSVTEANITVLLHSHIGVSKSRNNIELGCVAHSVMCLTTDMYLTADPGVASSIHAWSHTFVEIDHEIISRVIILIQEGLMPVTGPLI